MRIECLLHFPYCQRAGQAAKDSAFAGTNDIAVFDR